MSEIRFPPRHLLPLAIFLCLAILLAGPQAAGAQNQVPEVSLDATSQDFGRVPRGTVVTRTFTLRNAGRAPLKILGMEFSTPGMRARVAATVEPGESAQLEIEWDTSQYTRHVEGQAVLMLNDADTPRVGVTLTGFVVSPIEVDPVPAFYLSQFQGDSSSQTITVRNNQDRDVHITGVERQGENFSIDFEPVEPGRAYAVTATVSPETPPGRHIESAVVLTDDPDRPRIRLGVNILVKHDVHVSADAIEFGRVRIAALRANPSLLDLLRQTVVLEARSPTMRITEMEADLPFLTVSREPEAPAKRFQIDVGLDPGKLTAGEHRGTIRIHTDMEKMPQVILPVSISVAN